MYKYIFLPTLLIFALASCAPISGTKSTLISSPTTPTSTSTPTILPSATITSALSKTPFLATEPFNMDSRISPNGEHTAHSIFYYETEKQAIEIKDKDGKLIWQILYQGEVPHDDPRSTIGTYRWSNDSSLLYFCYYWSPDGGDIIIRYSCDKLQTIDIKTGEIRTVVPDGYTDFDISPDGSHIAYLQCGDASCTVHIRNLSTEDEKIASVLDNPKDYIGIGNISWSPSGTGLIFLTQNKDYITLQTMYVNISTMKYRLIKTSNTPLVQDAWAVFDGWVDDNTLKFLESGSAGIQVVQLNIRNNESKVIGTPTPRP